MKNANKNAKKNKYFERIAKTLDVEFYKQCVFNY